MRSVFFYLLAISGEVIFFLNKVRVSLLFDLIKERLPFPLKGSMLHPNFLLLVLAEKERFWFAFSKVGPLNIGTSFLVLIGILLFGRGEDTFFWVFSLVR